MNKISNINQNADQSQNKSSITKKTKILTKSIISKEYIKEEQSDDSKRQNKINLVGQSLLNLTSKKQNNTCLNALKQKTTIDMTKTESNKFRQILNLNQKNLKEKSFQVKPLIGSKTSDKPLDNINFLGKVSLI